MNIVVAAHHTWGVQCIERLIEMGIEPRLVITTPNEFDVDPGPYHHTWYASVAEHCLTRGLPLLQPEELNSPEVVQATLAIAPDLIVNIAYGGIYKVPLLDTPRFGILNLHGSLLPKYRGVTPIANAIIHGESKIGVTAHLIEARIDAGPVLLQQSVVLDPGDHAWEAFDKTWHLYPDMLASLLEAGPDRWEPRPQGVGAGSYHGRRTRAQEAIDWSQNAAAIRDLVRGLAYPYRGAHTALAGRQLIAWRAAAPVTCGISFGNPGSARIVPGGNLEVQCGDGSIAVSRVTYKGATGRPGDVLGRDFRGHLDRKPTPELERSRGSRW